MGDDLAAANVNRSYQLAASSIAIFTFLLFFLYVIQRYTVKYPGTTLRLSTFYEPGANGRIEQFLVTPGE